MIRNMLLVGAVCGAAFTVAAAAPKKAAPFKLAPSQTAVYVKNMHCAGCARKIARKVYGVKGVVRVETNVKANRLVVTPQKKKKIAVPAVWAAVQNAGFPPVKLIGPDGTYTPHPKTGAPQLVPKEAKKKTPAAAR